MVSTQDYFEQPRYRMMEAPSVPDLASGEEEPPTADEIKDISHRWFFGQGVGETIVNVGTVVVFPYYAIYLVGNAGAELMGYERLSLLGSIPDPVREPATVVYDGVTSAPGLVNSAVFGESFYSASDVSAIQPARAARDQAIQ
jgi:hypothetical protein